MRNQGTSLHDALLQVIRYHFIRYHQLLGTIGLYRGQPPILGMLWEKDGRTQKDIAEALGLRPPTVTIILRRMEKNGLVRRETDPEDLRAVRVYLTERGRNLQKEVERIHRVLEKECFSGFTQNERQRLHEFLIRIRENLEKATGRYHTSLEEGDR
uniref:MarR family transcriptional regulator n=1 Tax=Candidatus Caldatribacterium saccharofermentans TaxID=1454753 RepID=A0A7V4TWZ5_9BACT